MRSGEYSLTPVVGGRAPEVSKFEDEATKLVSETIPPEESVLKQANKNLRDRGTQDTLTEPWLVQDARGTGVKHSDRPDRQCALLCTSRTIASRKK